MRVCCYQKKKAIAEVLWLFFLIAADTHSSKRTRAPIVKKVSHYLYSDSSSLGEKKVYHYLYSDGGSLNNGNGDGY